MPKFRATSNLMGHLKIAMVVMALAAPCTVLAEDNGFSIDSHIPEKFEDVQWQLSTSAHLYGNDQDTDYLTNPADGYDQTYDTDAQRRNATLQSYSRYRYETIPRFLQISLDASATYSYLKDQQNSAYSDRTYPNYCSWYSRKQIRELSAFSASPYAEGGLYFSGDWFISMVSAVCLRYEDAPINSDDRINRSRELRGGEDSVTYADVRLDAGNSARDSRIYDVSLSIAPGWGRVYDGVFASTAMYMIDELRKNGLLAAEPSIDQMLELCELIYQYRLKHAIDYRLHKIETLETICRFLESEGIITNNGPLAYLLIQDVWSYFPDLPNFSRRFGLRVRLGLGYDMQYTSSHMARRDRDVRSWEVCEGSTPCEADTSLNQLSRSDSRDKLTDELPYVLMKAEYFKPLNLRWQLDVSVAARHYFSARSEGTHDYVNYTSQPAHRGEFRKDYDCEDFLEFDWSTTALYIPSSRTYLDFTASAGYGHLDRSFTIREISTASPETEEQFKGKTLSKWNYALSTGLTYRIYIPLTLRVTGSYSSGEPIRNQLPWYRSYDEFDTDGYEVNVSIAYQVL